MIIFSLATGSITLYSLFLPHVAEIALANQSEEEKSVLRESEMIGTAHLLVLGAITSYLTKSPLPLFLGVILSLTMFATYEYAMAR